MLSGIISGRRQKGECGIVAVPEPRRRYFALILVPLYPPSATQKAERKLISPIGIFGGYCLVRSFLGADARGAHDSREGYNSQYYNEWEGVQGSR